MRNPSFSAEDGAFGAYSENDAFGMYSEGNIL